MTDPQGPRLPRPEAGWVFTVPPPAKCHTGRLPYPLVVEGPRPITGNHQSPDKKRWHHTVTLYAVHPGGNEVMEWVNSEQGDGLGAFERGMVVLDNLWTITAGVYMYQVAMLLLDKESGMVERHAVARSEYFSAEMGFDNSSIRFTYQVKQDARKAIVESPLPKRPKLLEQFRSYLQYHD